MGHDSFQNTGRGRRQGSGSVKKKQQTRHPHTWAHLHLPFLRPHFLGPSMEGIWTMGHVGVGVSGGVSAGVLWLSYPHSARGTLLAYLEQPGALPRAPEGLVWPDSEHLPLDFVSTAGQ